MSDLSALHDMTLFVEVARTRNFSAAGRQLGVPVATLSRRIAAMEREFGVRLFDRTTRRVELTEAGARYFERCAHLADEARLAQEALRETATRPSGHLRVSVPVDLGVSVIGPLLPEFARQFPAITLDVDLSSRAADLVGDRVDVAIRLGEVKGDQLVARRIGHVGRGLFASPTYLDLRGTPTRPEDLAGHAAVLLRTPRLQARWRLERDGDVVDVTVHGRVVVNNHGLARLLAERGMGLAVLTPDLVRDALASGRLVRVLPQWALAPLPVNAVMSSRLQPASVKAFVAFLADRLGG